jgi:hypothetical protein
MKQCNKCKQELSFSEFHKNSRKKDGYQDYCKSCKKEYDKKQWVKHSDKWKPHYASKAQETRNWFNELRANESCAKCGDDRYYVIDYHHTNPAEKDIEVTQALKYSRKKVLNEIKKCVPLCSNCHREFHHLERVEGITTEQYLVL